MFFRVHSDMANERRQQLSDVNAYTPHRTTEHARAELRAVLQKVSAAWQNRRFEELADLFDENIVMVLPAFSGRIEGRKAVVDSSRSEDGEGSWRAVWRTMSLDIPHQG